MKRTKIGIVTSRGGHIYQMYQLKPWWQHYERFWVTFPGEDTETLLSSERVYFGYAPDTRHIIHAVRHLFLAWRVLRKERPDMIISCGAGIAPPFFYIAKLLGIKTIFIEVYDFISQATVSGRLIAPIADIFLVQHLSQKRFYPRALYKGAIL